MADDERVKKAIAEFIGTFTLIYIGVLVLTTTFAMPLIVVAFAHGLAIAVMVSATMMISGGQLNPAVTLGVLVGKKIDATQAGYNWIAQILGGTLGGFLAKASIGGASIVAGVPDLAPGVTIGQGILVEAILTFFLVFVVYGTGVDPRFNARIGGLAIGLTIAMDIMAGGPLTGGAMNPARWIGSAIPANHYNNMVVYIVGPLLGGAIAGFVYTMFLEDKSTMKAA
ncbi:MAG: MIP/aquaporin family protein [Thermoplasmatota archaeon]